MTNWSNFHIILSGSTHSLAGTLIAAMLTKSAPFLLKEKLRKQPRGTKALCLFVASIVILYIGRTNSRHYVRNLEMYPMQRGLTSPTLADTSNEDLEVISAFASKNGNSITLVVVTHAYLELTLSWICNVQVGGFMPKGLIFLTSEAKTYEILKEIPNTETVLVNSLNGGNEETGTEYKTPGYWRLMLDRTILISNLLRMDIDVFLVETDSVWLRDPMHTISNYTMQQESPEILGIMQSDRNINGGFLYVRSTIGTKYLYRYIEGSFKREFIRQGMDKVTSPSYRKGIKNDQTYLTHILFHDKSFQSKYKIKFQPLDANKFVFGNWYEKNTFYGVNAISPTVVNNNFIIGIDNKVARARRFGHWFLDDKTKKCSGAKVEAAIEKNNNAPAEMEMDILNIAKQVYSISKNSDAESDMETELLNISKQIYSLMHSF